MIIIGYSNPLKKISHSHNANQVRENKYLNKSPYFMFCKEDMTSGTIIDVLLTPSAAYHV